MASWVSEKNLSQVEARTKFQNATGIQTCGENMGTYDSESRFYYDVRNRIKLFTVSLPPVYFGKLNGVYVFVYDEKHQEQFKAHREIMLGEK